MNRGAVTFLDVLGWKGIWLRQSSRDVVSRLRKLVERAEGLARGHEGSTEVLSISDTIVLLTTGDDTKAISLHGEIASGLVCESIRAGLPLRGATACGEFFVERPSMMVGAAIDEAASWHEAVDWIGVVQTPSAFMKHRGSTGWRQARPPIKGGNAFDLPCADWPAAWRALDLSLSDLHRAFETMAPFDTGVAPKYLHTLKFFDFATTPPTTASKKPAAKKPPAKKPAAKKPTA